MSEIATPQTVVVPQNVVTPQSALVRWCDLIKQYSPSSGESVECLETTIREFGAMCETPADSIIMVLRMLEREDMLHLLWYLSLEYNKLRHNTQSNTNFAESHGSNYHVFLANLPTALLTSAYSELKHIRSGSLLKNKFAQDLQDFHNRSHSTSRITSRITSHRKVHMFIASFIIAKIAEWCTKAVPRFAPAWELRKW